MKIFIVTIPTRYEMAKKLATITNGEIVLDEIGNLADNHCRAWQKGFDSGEDYVLVLQDDVILADDFMNKLSNIQVDMLKSNYLFVSLYSNRKEDTEALARGDHYYIAKQWLNEQGVIMDRRILYSYLAYYAKNHLKYKHSWHDQLLQDFCKQYRIDIRVRVPNIVNHRTDVKSSVGHPSKTKGMLRTSRTFYENQADQSG